MHSFPPEIWKFGTSESTTVYAAYFCISVALTCVAAFRKRTATYGSIVAIWLITLCTLIGLSTRVETNRGWTIASPVWLFSSCLLTAIALLITLKRVPTERIRRSIFICLVGASLTTLLLGFVIPQFRSAQGAAERSQCSCNFCTLSLALANYDDVEGSLPGTAMGAPPRSWRVTILPYADNCNVYDAYDPELKWNEGPNLEIGQRMVQGIYRCPTSPLIYDANGVPYTAYCAVIGPDTLWNKTSRSAVLENVADGLSNTILLVEASGQQIRWSEPKDVELERADLVPSAPGHKIDQSNSVISSYHDGLAHVVMADGHSRTLSEKIDPQVLKALLTANGGESISPDAEF